MEVIVHSFFGHDTGRDFCSDRDTEGRVSNLPFRANRERMITPYAVF